MIFAGKKVLVFGTGKSGIAAEELLHKKGASVVLYDGNDKLEKEEILKKLESRDSVEVVLGELPEEMLDSLDLVVLSPGVPTDLPVVLKMKEKEIPVIGEVELAYQVSRGKVLAITGTNGKTTTTSLLGEIMKAYQPEVKVVGNIGTPYTSAALDTTDDTVTVAEISSFQLETIKEFHPAASAITNITEDHLNRHHTMEEYIRVKECITENQTMDDLCVLNYEDEILRPFGEKLMAEKKVQVMYFSSLRALKDGIYYQDGEIRIAKNGETELLTRTDDLKLLGLHNFENVMVASAMALHAGVPMETVRKVIQEFAGVEHRIEYVCEKDGVAYYNDSKGTNPDAAIKGIQAMNRPTLLIGGGYDKESSYDEWIESFDGKVRYLVLIGQTDALPVIAQFHRVLSGGGHRDYFLFLIELNAHLLAGDYRLRVVLCLVFVRRLVFRTVERAENHRVSGVLVHEAHQYLIARFGQEEGTHATGGVHRSHTCP